MKCYYRDASMPEVWCWVRNQLPPDSFLDACGLNQDGFHVVWEDDE